MASDESPTCPTCQQRMSIVGENRYAVLYGCKPCGKYVFPPQEPPRGPRN